LKAAAHRRNFFFPRAQKSLTKKKAMRARTVAAVAALVLATIAGAAQAYTRPEVVDILLKAKTGERGREGGRGEGGDLSSPPPPRARRAARTLSFAFAFPACRRTARTRFHTHTPMIPSPSFSLTSKKKKTELAKRGPHWAASVSNWECDPGAEKGGPGCDPCAPSARDEWWSEWEHITCRGPDSYLDDAVGGAGDGRVTNLHFVQRGVEGPTAGPVVDLFCGLGDAIHEVCACTERALMRDGREKQREGEGERARPIPSIPHQTKKQNKNHTTQHQVDITSSSNNPDPADHISGPLPPQIQTCFPHLHQFEFSYNSLDGPLPTWPTEMRNLSYFKMVRAFFVVCVRSAVLHSLRSPFLNKKPSKKKTRHTQRANNFTGPIPPEFGTMPQLFRLDLGKNKLSNPGPAAVPATFANHPTLGIFQIDGNAGLTGHVLGLSGTHLQVAMLSPNAGLCGPVPSSVRWAVGFNTTGTALGQPCSGPAAAAGPASAPLQERPVAAAQPRVAAAPAPARARPQVAAAGGPAGSRDGDL
jgi:hypothetical protein